jgi:hypothetical protein
MKATSLGSLLTGHLKKRRKPELLEIAVAAFQDASLPSRLVTSVLNATLRVRQLFRRHVLLAAYRAASRARYIIRVRTGRQPSSARPRTLSLVCPTRERVNNVGTLIDSVLKTAVRPERVELLFYIDADDPQREAYLDLFKTRAHAYRRLLDCKPVIGEPGSVARAWTVLAQQSTGDLVMMSDDDQVYVTYGWDEVLDVEFDAYPDEIVCMYFDNDRYDHEMTGLPRGDFPIISRRWLELLGHLAPNVFDFWCSELWALDIAERINRAHAVPNVYVDHLHYDAYKSPFDATYLRHRLVEGRAARDRQMYAATVPERIKLAVRLNRAIARAEAPGASAAGADGRTRRSPHTPGQSVRPSVVTATGATGLAHRPAHSPESDPAGYRRADG